ncbi:MAG TPA: threonine synthase [Treponema sp.]|nr:threonine synthase [Treponema sp.]
MQFRSTKSKESLVSFKDAVLRCLPPDGGLYVPDLAMDLRQFFLYMDENIGYPELVAAVAPSLLQGELNPFSAARVAESAFDFEPELIRLDDDLSILNLYNGPAGVFKDFGIAFHAAALEELLKNSGRAVILSAARGDTGVSMARAFSGRKGIYAALVYPAGPIRGLDPAMLVSNGGNIIPVQIRGNYDDCQRLIIEAIKDTEFSAQYTVTSANAINPGRLLPQTFYYLYAFVKIKKYLAGDLAFSVPSGNFGNLLAGLYAWKFGMPVNSFIAAMNANNAFGDFIRGKPFVPRPLISTNSPALDVSIPANFERFASFYEEAPAVMRNLVHPAAIGDNVTARTIEFVWKKYGILIDPHTAVAFAAAEQTAKEREWGGNVHTVVLATGHPAKESGIVRDATGQNPVVPDNLLALQKETDPVAVISPELAAFKEVIMGCLR